MNAGHELAFRTDLAKRVFDTIPELERTLRATQKTLPPYTAECQAIREKLRKAYEDIIFLDFNFAHERDVENLLWMKVHHKTIEAYRSRISKFKTAHGKQKPVEFRKLLLNFTNFTKDAAKYYRAFIQRLIVHFQMTDLYHVLQAFHMQIPAVESVSIRYPKDIRELVVRSCHATMIYLGDLSRYRELQAATKNGQKNWGPALGYYQFARRLVPGAGKPMNQLAVVAIYSEDVLNSSYFFLRAICAMEEFPTARDNLALGFRKIAVKPMSIQANVIDRALHLIANLYTKDSFKDVTRDQVSVLQSLRQAIVEREVSADVLSRLITLIIGTAFVLKQAMPDTKEGDFSTLRSQSVDRLTIAMVETLLSVFSHELGSAILAKAGDSSQVSAIVRRILPALRIGCKWLELNLLAARSLWTNYIAAMTLCGSKFQRQDLPTINSPFPEDIDLRGFRPLEGGLSKSHLEDAKEPAHPNVETLARLTDLLNEAAVIAPRIDKELSQSQNAGQYPIVEAASSGVIRTRQAVAAVDISEKHAAPAHMSIDPLNNEGQIARLNEPSMAFSLDQMVDSLVGHAGEDEEEFVFTGRRNR